MKTVIDSLDVIFRRVSPEFVMDSYLKSLVNTERPVMSVSDIDRDTFYRFSRQTIPNLSRDEIDWLHDYLDQKMTEENDRSGKRNIFRLLTSFSKEVLQENYGDPVCEKEHILKWRDTYLRLGQDIFTTSYLAAKDQRSGRRRSYYAWPAVIRSNHPQIGELLKQGLSENHYHLYGSVPVFQLSWVSLMNHPRSCLAFEKEQKAAAKFRENLMPALSTSHRDRQMTWTERIRLAAWIRVKLFFRLMEIARAKRSGASCANVDHDRRMLEEMRNFLVCRGKQNQEVCHLIERAGVTYGKKVPLRSGQQKYLDYAYPEFLNDDRNEGYCRLFVGERFFLYCCFYICFAENGCFTEDEMNLFYLYLLIKSNLRSELIQVNGRVGFYNFAEYQDRKQMFWFRYPEYKSEAYRMAVIGNIRSNRLNSLELRITPGNTKEDLLDHIYKIDREMYFSGHSCPEEERGPRFPTSEDVMSYGKNTNYFYVLHFPKRKLERVSGERIHTGRMPIRNRDVRRKTKRQALAMARALIRYDYLCYRIRGIDGCSAEIGCRPETFATEFRFLRSFVPLRAGMRPQKETQAIEPLLSATYHVGEDFLELADGLRAVDEAVRFLNLRRGDRLGHALALGIDAEKYYRGKNAFLIVSKQDRLDDLVWLLFRSRDLGVSVSSDLEFGLTQEAEALLNHVYGNYFDRAGMAGNLQMYYESWRLRGDHPSLYEGADLYAGKRGTWAGTLAGSCISVKHQYELYKENISENVILNKNICSLMYGYHYDFEVRKRGQEPVNVEIRRDYVKLVTAMQDGMIRQLAYLGISVECNPSSNVLIGPFDRYDEHPIFRFNRAVLSEDSGDNDAGSRIELCVSVNTDDQGVFDTSLENEYALLACSLEKQRKEGDVPRYSPSVIWQYLNYLRSMGEMQVFPKAFKSREDE